MSTPEPYEPNDDVVERASAAWRDMSVPGGPSAELLAGTLSAIRAKGVGHLDASKGGVRRILTMKLMMKLAVAAVLAVSVGALVWKGGPWGGQLVFADVLQKVNGVHSVRMKAIANLAKDALPPGAAPAREITITIVGNRMRQDMPGSGAMIMDHDRGQVLTIDPANKRAVRMKLDNMPRQMREQNVLEEFRQMGPDNGKPIGRKEIAGRSTDGFQVEQPGKVMTIWADSKTRLPVLIEASLDVSIAPKAQIVMKDFEWDVQIDESTMSLDVPAGYEVQEMTFDASKPTEKDLIESFRTLTKETGGAFPKSFDMAGITTAMVPARAAMKAAAGKPTQKQITAEVMAKMMKIMRGVMFVQPGNGEDFHYAGKGAKLGEAGRPIFWYKPAGVEMYRVITADLQVSDVKASELPKIESQKLTAMGPATKPAAATSQRE